MAIYYGANWHYSKNSTQREAVRACAECGQVLPLNAYRLESAGEFIYKRVEVCPDCEEKAAEAARVAVEPQTKKCPACFNVKPLAEFKSIKGYETRTCRKCLDRIDRNAARTRAAKKERERLENGGLD